MGHLDRLHRFPKRITLSNQNITWRSFATISSGVYRYFGVFQNSFDHQLYQWVLPMGADQHPIPAMPADLKGSPDDAYDTPTL